MTLLHENSMYNSLILFKHNILRILINLKKKKKTYKRIYFHAFLNLNIFYVIVNEKIRKGLVL